MYPFSSVIPSVITIPEILHTKTLDFGFRPLASNKPLLIKNKGDWSRVVCFTLEGLLSIVKDLYSVSGYDTVSSFVFKIRE